MNDGRIKTMEARFAKILVKLNKAIMIDDYKTKVITQSEKQKTVELSTPDDIQKVREEYQKLFGKRAYHGWGVEEIKEKIRNSSNI